MATDVWHIVGTGAIGAFCAANLHQRSNQVTLLARRSVNRLFFVEEQEQIDLAPLVKDEVDSPIQNLLIPTKAYDVVPAFEQYHDCLAKGANVVLCHNGMGTIEQIQKHLPQDANLYFCTTSNGAFRQQDKVTLAGLGQSFWQAISIGSKNTELNNADFTQLFRTSEQANNLPMLLWRKLLINCAINPLTAIFDVKNGELSQHRFSDTIAKVISEVIEVAAAEGIKLDDEDARALVYSVIQATANNTSSMRQDILAKRQTEIDYINGYVCQMAEANNIRVATNVQLTQQVKGLTSGALV